MDSDSKKKQRKKIDFGQKLVENINFSELKYQFIANARRWGISKVSHVRSFLPYLTYLCLFYFLQLYFDSWQTRSIILIEAPMSSVVSHESLYK